ncbi:MAG: type IV pilus biogenesis/stability protein PilW [Steroidobacteraceae bacterium]
MKTRKPYTLLLAAMSVLLLAGCATQNEGKTDPKKAADLNVKLGVHYIQQGQLQLAKEKLERAEKQDPGNFEVHWALAQLSEKLAKPEEAERHYQIAMRLAPENSALINTYAVFLCTTQKVDKALPLLDGVISDRLYPTPWAAATNAALCLRSDKRNADAAPYLERALNMRNDYEPAVIQMADLQLDLGKSAVSRQVVDRYLALPRKSADVLVVGVRAALAQGDRAAAENYGRLLRRDFPSSSQAQALPQLLQPAK